MFFFSPQTISDSKEEPATLNLESFSEVSLESATEDTFLGQSSKIVEEKTTSDVNDLFYNAPAALTNSLAQLPNVASTVFSTFSNIIKGSPRIEPTVREQPTNDFSIPRNNPIDYNIYAPTAPPASEEPKIIQPPPTFYSATDSLTPKRPEIPTGSNSYRLTNVKKTYAKIPGLFTGGAPLIPDKIESAPIPQQEYNYDSYQQPPPPPQESGKFSLSTFFPTGIIDKLQQTVYGENNSTDTQDNSVPNYPPPPQQVQGYFENPSNIQGFFGVSQPPTPPRQTTPFEVQSVPAFVPQVTSTPFELQSVPAFVPPVIGFAPTPFEVQSVPAFQQQPTVTNQQAFFTPIPAVESQSNISAPPSIPVGVPPPSLSITGDRQNPYSIRGKKTFFNKNPHIETSAQPFSELLSRPTVINPVNFFNPCPEIEEKTNLIPPEVQSNFFKPIESDPELTEEIKLSTTPPPEVEQFREFPGLSSTTSFNASLVSPITSEVPSNFFSPSERPVEPFNNFFESESVKQFSEFPAISTENSQDYHSSFFSSSESILPAVDPFNNYFKPIVESELIKSENQVEQFSDFPGLSSRNSFDSNLISEIGDNSTVNTEVIDDSEEASIDTLNLLQQTSNILQHDLNKGELLTLSNQMGFPK